MTHQMEESQSTVGESENGDAFYEQIEAPKFVDLNAPDHFHPGDDRFWFCSRVGCDRRHEEEMDHEEIYQKFVLRVMAARSPNIRLRKALYRNDSSLRCPQSVPAKPSKPKVSRLDLISSMSKRLVDPKVMRVKPVSKPVTQPIVKVKQSSAASKALTTPGKKKKIANPDVFRSVRNPKAAAMVVSKNNIVAKALVFHSPKKSGREKTLLELKTPIKTVSGKKSGRAKASSELKTPIRTLSEGMKKLEIDTGKKNVLGCRADGLGASRKQPRVREVKSRVYDGLLPKNRKAREAKSAEVLKKKIENKSSHPQEGDHNNFTEMETDVCSKSKCAETEMTSQPSSDEASVGGNVPKIQAPIEEGSNDGEEHGDETCPIACEFDSRDTDSKLLDSDENEKERSETKESDKENTSASDDNREKNAGHTHKSTTQKQVSRTISKKPKDSSTIIATKHAPTNPKPFRLRTDARRILKEANLEKKPQIGPLKEKLGTRLPGEALQKKPYKSGQENGTSILKSSKERTGRKFSATPVRHTVSSQQKLVTSLQEHKAPQKLGNSLRETNSPLVRQKIAKPRGITPGQLGVINETSPAISRHKEAAKLSENGTPLTTVKNSSASPTSTPLKQKKLTTIPKEPKFHTIHVPKSCTRRVA